MPRAAGIQWHQGLPELQRRSPLLVLATMPLLFASAAFGQICTPGSIQQAVRQLEDSQKRAVAQKALQQCGEAAVKPLASALSNPNAIVRRSAAQTLGQIGQSEKSAVTALVQTSQEDSDPNVKSSAILSLGAIARASKDKAAGLKGWQTAEIQDLKDLQKDLDKLLTGLGKDKKSWPTKADDLDTLRLARTGLQTQLGQLTDQPTYRAIAWVQSHPWSVGIGLLGVVVVGSYGVVFFLKPIWLLKRGEGQVKAISNIPKVGTILSGVLQVLSPLKYHPRVLDAWVAQHISTAREKLSRRPTFQRHEIHIAQPVFLQDKPEPVQFKPENFSRFFTGTLRLVIWGEGGAGKTSLACQLAYWAMWGRTEKRRNKNGEDQVTYEDDKELVKRLCKHRMLPVLIEEKLVKGELLIKISALLKDFTGQSEHISDELLLRLLQERRILVIADHLSELDETTQQELQPSRNQKFPVAALIVTTRRKDILGPEAAPVFVQPNRITEKNLAEFLNRYLPEKQRREGITLTFRSEDYADAYRHLGSMISLRQAAEKNQGQPKGTTILLVTLYADQMIVEKQKREALGEDYYTTHQNLADNVPDLMLNYLDALNNKDAAAAFPGGLKQPEQQQEKLYKLAQLVAWKCLENSYKPESVSKPEVLKALIELEKTLKTEQPPEMAEQDLAYLQDTLYLIQFQPKDQTLRFSLDPLAEYLAALHLLWKYNSNRTDWMRLLTLIEQVENRDEVQGFLLALYDCCDKKGRGKPIQVPEDVLTKLVSLTNLDEAAVAEYHRKRRMRLALEDLKENSPTYQLRAVADLASIAEQDKTLNRPAIGCLKEVLDDETRMVQVRREAGKALRKLDTQQVEAVLGGPLPLLVPEIREGVERLRLVTPPPEQVGRLIDTVALEFVQIPSGEFWMGSEEGEGEDNEHPLHQVRVDSFWMGCYPVTQAQWRLVATLPKVKIDLDPDPSRFKGAERPVESVSWWEVTEFCDRLSQKTGQIYRLPSEAEWEYACRARTDTPYHFGERITEEFANYSGRNTPHETTSVGQYGVANAFGLYDMHGNVWEWCIDHWHDDYMQAPRDGSPWLSEDENARRLLRGGSWNYDPANCRSAYRNWSSPDDRSSFYGFRVVLRPA
jgi:formylglycine-generating enzyme required for sulfatase activity/HEAT repeat protein